MSTPVPAWVPPAYNSLNWNTPLDIHLARLTDAVNTPQVVVGSVAPVTAGPWVFLNVADPNNAILTFDDGL